MPVALRVGEARLGEDAVDDREDGGVTSDDERDER